ncbi:Uncharacterised protein [Mycobacteroides abscessus subsp. abscessus]|uniref:hypothetical protein n=1 Tax=Mycobacteroides abscessus TaxID=36809 RepID=UPI00092BEB63|nr:hypothetical protein [Mycobacteroides abscessus]SHT83569.1 Uncharacterised protein [Mycobacteroides abscessus subsp. abscessus]SKO52362.1 Uncharacterised protein [Mycobacteroides abscessus subsp. abscessus]
MIKTPTRNTELMLKVWTHLTDHPEVHNQRNWAKRPWDVVDIHAPGDEITYENVCGTKMCLCGDAMLLSGYRLRYFKRRARASGFMRPDGSTDGDFVAEGAALFGLNREQAAHLFTCTMDNVDALMLLRSLIDEDGEFERDIAACEGCKPSHWDVP